MKKAFKWFIVLVFLTLVGYYVLSFYGLIPGTFYYANDFNITVIKSTVDYDMDEIDDYTDILEGAKKESEAHPTYKSAYYAGGYPPDNEGVCTDVIWRSLKNAGYNLKDLVDEHIEHNKALYTHIKKPDPNIDFRRVKNLAIYFKETALILTNDPYKIEEWMPGDIVIFGDKHIGIISDRRNEQGITFMIHNAGQLNRDEDALIKWHDKFKITGHYRLKTY